MTKPESDLSSVSIVHVETPHGDDRLGIAADHYGESPKTQIALAVVALLVAVGSSPTPGLAAGSGIVTAAALLSNIYIQTQFDRIKLLIKSIDRIAASSGQQNDWQFLESAEGHDLVFRAVEATRKTRDQDRIEAIANILVGRIKNTLPPETDPEALVSLLPELSENEATALRALWVTFLERPNMSGFDNRYFQNMLVEPLKQQGAFLLGRLIARGLLVEESSPSDMGRGPRLTRVIKFTPTGRVLMNYLPVRTPSK